MIIYLPWQTQSIYFLQELFSFIPDGAWQRITNLGYTNVALLLGITLIYHRGARAVLALFLNAIIVVIATISIKGWLNFSRPPVLLDHDRLNIIGDELCCNSFPSGHSTSVAVFCSLIFLTTKNIYMRSGALLFALTVGLSRIMVGAHWPQDVIAGFLLGSLVTFVLFPFFSNMLAKFFPTFGISVTPIYRWIIFGLLALLWASSFLNVDIVITSILAIFCLPAWWLTTSNKINKTS
ncbi:MAG: phosphatase PAP2 family protein [SAR324 cluster bacterium]|nr:phosphatase PAP2 family protein [SAR324 cluster bacterium]